MMKELTLIVKYTNGNQHEQKTEVPEYKLGKNAMRNVIANLVLEEDPVLEGAVSIHLLGNINDDETMSFPLQAE
jgi:hypothetical protein